MKALRVAWKYLLEFWREPQMLGLALGLPVFFVFITAVGYGTAPRLATYPLAMVVEAGLESGLQERLAEARYPDGRAVFNVKRLDNAEAMDASLKAQNAVMGVLVRKSATGEPMVIVRGDGTAMAFTRASVQLERILADDTRQAVKLVETPLALIGAASDFELYAPGMIVFAILLLIPQTAMLVGREVREGTMTRLRLSRLGAAGWLGGLTISQMVVAVGQVLLTFAAAAVFGFRSRGPLLLAVGIGLLLSLSAIAMGLVVGRFSRSDSDAINVGSVFTMLQVFLSGSFFAMPGSTLLEWGNVPLGLYDVLPATHGNLVLQQVMIGGADLALVWPRLVIMAGLSGVIFGVCWLIFRR